MVESALLDKIYTSCIKNNLSSSARLFYVYLLFNMSSDNTYLLNDTAYICYLFGCSTRALHYWIIELVTSNLIDYEKKVIHVH